MNKVDVIKLVAKGLFSLGIYVYERRERKKREKENEKPVDSK